MTIKEMLDTIDSLNAECLYELPNFTFDEVCDNFVSVKFEGNDDPGLKSYYHDGAGADAISGEMNSIKGYLNKAGKTILAVQSLLGRQVTEANEEGVIVIIGTQKSLNAQLEDIIMSISQALTSAVNICYNVPDEITQLLDVVKELKEEIDNSKVDIFDYLKHLNDQDGEHSDKEDDINKWLEELKNRPIGMTEQDWKDVTDAIDSGIARAVGDDSAIQKEIQELLDKLREQGIAIENLGRSTSAAKFDVYDTYIEGTVANLGINIDGTMDYSRSHLVMTSDEAYITAQKIHLDSAGNVSNIRTAGLVLQSDYLQDITAQFDSEGEGTVDPSSEVGFIVKYKSGTETAAEGEEGVKRTHKRYNIEHVYTVRVDVEVTEKGKEEFAFALVDSFDKVVEIFTTNVSSYTFTKHDEDLVLVVSDKHVKNVYIKDDSGAYSTLFAQAVDNYSDADGNQIVKTADISAFVKYVDGPDGTKYLQSGILLRADQIRVEGVTEFVSDWGTFLGLKGLAYKDSIEGMPISYDDLPEKLKKELSDWSTEIGSKASLDDVWKALTGKTYIEGGYIKTELIDVTKIVATKIEATEGHIGGFAINNNSIGTEQGDSESGYEPAHDYQQRMYMDNSMIIFNAPDRQAIIGTPTFYGTDMVGRFYNEKQNLGTNYGIGLTVKNGATDNIALAFGGGSVSGLALKNELCGLGSYSADQSTLSKTIPLSTNTVLAYTQYYSGSTAKTRDVYLTLPDVRDCDDGHMIRIKRGAGGDNTVRIYPGTHYETDLEGIKLSLNFSTLGFINKYTGALDESMNYLYSDFVNVQNYRGYTLLITDYFGSGYGCAFYDSNQKFVAPAVTGEGSGQTIQCTVPQTAVYLRCCRFNNTTAAQNFHVMTTSGTQLTLNFYSSQKGALRYNSGDIVNGYMCTGLVNVYSNRGHWMSVTNDYLDSNAGVVFYDASGEYLGYATISKGSYSTTYGFRVPNDAYYMKVSRIDTSTAASKFELRDTEIWGEIACPTAIISDKWAQTHDYLELQSEGDAFTLLFFASLVTNFSDGTKTTGAWVEWKNPRDW